MDHSFSRLACIAGLCLAGCSGPAVAELPETGAMQPEQAVAVSTPALSIDAAFLQQASIYEVNVRQFSQAGTLAEVTRQIPRLRALGVDILWLMPLQPIGEAKRKGPLGSYYSIRDYTAVNPEFGTLDDVRTLVDTAHAHGQLVILDWVANHTAWDHPWITQHPDWYTKNAAGEIVDPVDPATGESWGWTDVADLNYSSKALWTAMVDAMQFWLDETGIDGFRCDVASEVPTDFWLVARRRLDAVKPVFMLAEAEKPELAAAFDMSYGWEFLHLMNGIASGERQPVEIDRYMQRRAAIFPVAHTLMMFTTNHDENAWNGTVFERYGSAHKAFAVLAFTLDGMPLVYSGQEAGIDRRLEFFSRDPISWNDYPLQPFYTTLLELKEQLPALAHGAAGGRFMRLIYQSDNPAVYAFSRATDDSAVLVAVNFSDAAATLTFAGDAPAAFTMRFGEATVAGAALSLPAYGFAVMAKAIPD